jgi:hypothetical protein
VAPSSISRKQILSLAHQRAERIDRRSAAHHQQALDVRLAGARGAPAGIRSLAAQRHQQAGLGEGCDPAGDDLGGRLEAPAADVADRGDQLALAARPLADHAEHREVEHIARTTIPQTPWPLLQ